MCNSKEASASTFIAKWIETSMIYHTRLEIELDESQCTGAIDSANNAVWSADFKNVISKIIHWTNVG